MFIHMVTDRFEVGGGIEHIYQVVKGLKKFNFRIFGEPGNAIHMFDNLENVETFPIGYSPSNVLAPGIQPQPDLVHIHQMRPMFSFARQTGAITHGIPVIFTAHGLHIHKYEFYGSLTSKLKYWARFFIEKRMLRKPGQILAVSREDQVFLEEKYGLSNVTYLTNGINFGGIREIGQGLTKKEMRKKLDLPDADFLFTTVARFNFQKGYDILLPAIALLKDMLSASDKNSKQRKAHFLFIGAGPEFGKMQQLAQALGISPYVSFLGEREREEVYQIVKASDVFLLPSRWEGLPIVLLETGLLSTPVLASATYGNREILSDDRGILFRNLDVADCAGKIGEIIQGKYDLEAYASALYQEVERNYNLDKMLTGLEKIYSSYNV